MFKEALEYLREHLSASDQFNVGDGDVFSRPMFNPPRPDLPLPKPRVFSTLAGLAQFIREDPDVIGESVGWMIHVTAPHVVELVRWPNDNGERDVRVRVTCPTQAGASWLDQWVSQEDMLIGLLGCAPGGDLDPLVKGVQSIKREAAEVSELADGGQKASASFRIGMTEWLQTGEGAKTGPVDLNKVVHLAPFRTFSEVEQPVGTFVFRIRGGEGQTQVKLIPTPDATWHVEAVTAIKAKLEELLAGVEHAPPVIC